MGQLHFFSLSNLNTKGHRFYFHGCLSLTVPSLTSVEPLSIFQHGEEKGA